MDIFYFFKKQISVIKHNKIFIKNNSYVKNHFLFFIYTTNNVKLQMNNTKNKINKNIKYVPFFNNDKINYIMETIMIKNYIYILEKKAWFKEDVLLKISRYKTPYHKYIKRTWPTNEALFKKLRINFNYEMQMNEKINFCLDKTNQNEKNFFVPLKTEEDYFFEKKLPIKNYHISNNNNKYDFIKKNFLLKIKSKIIENEFNVQDNVEHVDCLNYLNRQQNFTPINDYISFESNTKFNKINNNPNPYKLINFFYKTQKKSIRKKLLFRELLITKNFYNKNDDKSTTDFQIYDKILMPLLYINLNKKKTKKTYTVLSYPLKIFLFFNLIKNYYGMEHISFEDITNRKIINVDIKLQLSEEITKTDKKFLKKMKNNPIDNFKIFLQQVMLKRNYSNFKGILKYVINNDILSMIIKKNLKFKTHTNQKIIFKNEDSNFIDFFEATNVSIFFLKKKTKYNFFKKKYVILQSSTITNQINTLSEILKHFNYKFAYFVEINKIEKFFENLFLYFYEHFTMELKHKHIKNFPLIEFCLKFSFLIITKNANSFTELLENIMYTQPIRGQKILIELLDSFEEHKILEELNKYKVIGLWLKFSGKVAVKAGDRAAHHIIKFGMYSRNRKIVKTNYNEDILKTNGGSIGFKCYIFYN